MKNEFEKIVKANKSKKDIVVIILITFLTTLFLIEVDGFELIYNYSQSHEEYELDEIILTTLVLSILLLWYSARRYFEIKKLMKLLEYTNKELEKENIKKDDLLIEQSKMASLGEMIENIAHQWRQPLSAISLLASGLKIKKEYIGLEENELENTMDDIVNNTNYLSTTIDNFRSFAKDEKRKVLVNPDENIKKNLNILKGILKSSNIDIILNLNTNKEISTYSNELSQVFINIISNAKDALKQRNIKQKCIFISSDIKSNKLYIIIKDNAGGIADNIISKIFEPYFTTKHKSQGTGLGLYMSYKIIKERIKGDISVENDELLYKNKKYIGAKFTLIIPIEEENKDSFYNID